MQRICGWCDTPNTGDNRYCAHCEGPLPSPPGADPGPTPEATPRRLPDGYPRVSFRIFAVAFGSIFGSVGLAIMLGFGAIAFLADPMALFVVGFGAIFFGVGITVIFAGIRGMRRRARVLQLGAVTTGTVSEVRQGGGYWMFTYLYEVDGKVLSDRLQTKDNVVSKYAEGDLLHVVYEPDNPSFSTIWPPLQTAM